MAKLNEVFDSIVEQLDSLGSEDSAVVLKEVLMDSINKKKANFDKAKWGLDYFQAEINLFLDFCEERKKFKT